ncbi:TPA: polysaccharide pyruvyl transferase family protein [Klebsiella aerogenes]|nr:polysaccharide pyruvyl transferase family protein [Klebsiella aerogenes]
MLSKKVLIINENCSDNIGDHAINEGVKKLVLDNGFEPISVGFDAEFKKVTPKKINVDINWRAKVRELKYRYISSNPVIKYTRWILNNNKRMSQLNFNDFEFVIIGGGQLIQSGGTFPIALYQWVKKIKKHRIPVYVLGVGCAEKFSYLDRFLIKIALSDTAAVYVREQQSIKKVNDFFDIKASYIPDLAYCLYPAKLNHKKIISEKYVMVGSTSYYVYTKNMKELGDENYKTLSDYISMWQDIIENEIISGEKVILLSTTKDDAFLNEYIYHSERIKPYSDSILLVKDIPDLDEYLNHMSNIKKIYSGRMHSLILGHIFNCELKAVRLNKKIDYYMDEYSRDYPEVFKNKIYDIFNTL